MFNNNAQQFNNQLSESMPTNRIVMVIKDGNVTCALRDFNGNISWWKETNLPFKTGTAEASIPNCIYALNVMLKQLTDEEQYPGRFIFALPASVYHCLTQLEVFTKQFAYGVVYTSVPQSSSRYSQNNSRHQNYFNNAGGTSSIDSTTRGWTVRKTAFMDTEKKLYIEFITNFMALLGKVIFVNQRMVDTANNKDSNWTDIKALAINDLYSKGELTENNQQ